MTHILSYPQFSDLILHVSSLFSSYSTSNNTVTVSQKNAINNNVFLTSQQLPIFSMDKNNFSRNPSEKTFDSIASIDQYT